MLLLRIFLSSNYSIGGDVVQASVHSSKYNIIIAIYNIYMYYFNGIEVFFS